MDLIDKGTRARRRHRYLRRPACGSRGGLATGVGGWIGVAARDSGVGLAAMFQAGLNVAVPALFVVGVGTLL